MPDPLPSALAAAAEARRRVLARLRRLPNRRRAELLPLARAELARAEPLLARALKDAQVLAWLEGGRDSVRALALPPAPAPVTPFAPPVYVPGGGNNPGPSGNNLPPAAPVPTPFTPTFVPSGSPEFRNIDIPESVAESPPAVVGGLTPPAPPPPPPGGYFPDRPGDAEPPVRFPQVEKAARWLATRLDYTPDEFRALDDEARTVAFTVAGAATLDAVTRVREALEEDVARGGTLRQFRAVVAEALGESALGKGQVETLYRTATARAYSAGQREVLSHPLVADELPYLLYSATHDGRVRPEHLAMERLGLQGTAVYRADDPIWDRYYPPWGWRCRCIVVPLTVADAAARGVREAREWLRTGRPPETPEWVRPPPFDLPRGWVPTGKRLAAVI